MPAIIEQKVTGQEALGGVPDAGAPLRRARAGPPSAPDRVRLWVQPSPEQLRAIPSWEWLRLPVDGARSRADPARGPGRRRRWSGPAGETPDEFDRRLRTLPGIGVWTSAEVRFRALGDADAVSFGDYHIAANVGWVLTGQPVDDDGLAELLEPYRPTATGSSGWSSWPA